MKILENIADYFSGKKIRDFYAIERTFYMSHCLESKNLDKHLDKLAKDERKYIVFGTIVPNIIDLGSIVWAYSAKSALPLVITGASEGLRQGMIGEFEFKKGEYAIDQNIIRLQELSKPKNVEKLAEKIKNSS